MQDYERETINQQKRSASESEAKSSRTHPLSRASALGNTAVQRVLRLAGLQRSAGGGLDEETAGAIQARRGGGESLDTGVRRQMEASFGEDFSDVRVHSDGDADALNRAVQAEAFTTGRDIFFRSGQYSPGSSEGQKLLAHELTHVVQQRQAPPADELTVSDPSDASERQASHLAETMAGPEAAGVARQAEGEDEEMEKKPEEEIATSLVAREVAEDEDEMGE